MFDPRDLPAFWGLCGGLLSGVHGLVTAYSAKAGTPEARRKAWLQLGFGMLAGPIVAEAIAAPVIVKISPVLDVRGVSMVLGWMVANDPKGLFSLFKRVFRAVFNPEPR